MSNFTMPVNLYMSTPVHTASPDDTLEEVHHKLGALGISSLAVVGSGGALAGVVSRSDLLRVGRLQAGARQQAALLTLPDRPVSDIMTREAITVGPADPVALGASLMVSKLVHRVYVQEGEQLVGVLSTKDVMLAIRDKRMSHPIESFMSRPLFTVRASEPVSLATERLEKARVSGLVVVDEDWPVGVFTQVEALAARELARDTPIEEAMDPAMICMPSDTQIHRAAAQAAAMRVRRIIAARNRDVVGILSGIDFARAAAG